MFEKYVFVVLLFHGVLSDGPDKCIRYYFEDYEDLFTRLECNEVAPFWILESYDNSTAAAPNEMSELFIRAPSPGIRTCTSSFNFTMMPGGVIYVNIYLNKTANNNDRVTSRLFQITENGSRKRIGYTTTDATTGWQMVKVEMTETLAGNPPYIGFMRFWADDIRADTVLMIDSFRYVPPSMDPDTECILYEDVSPSTTAPTPTTTSTTTPTPTTTPTTDPATTPDVTHTTTTATTSTSSTPTTTPTTDPATTPDTTPTTTPITPTTKPPKNLTNSIVEELFDFRKSVRISKKKITKVVNFNGVEQPLLGLE